MQHAGDVKEWGTKRGASSREEAKPWLLLQPQILAVQQRSDDKTNKGSITSVRSTSAFRETPGHRRLQIEMFGHPSPN